MTPCTPCPIPVPRPSHPPNGHIRAADVRSVVDLLIAPGPEHDAMIAEAVKSQEPRKDKA